MRLCPGKGAFLRVSRVRGTRTLNVSPRLPVSASLAPPDEEGLPVFGIRGINPNHFGAA
jgi:hypothetical protein